MLISIVILLKEYDSHPLPYWSFHLNLNSWATDWVLKKLIDQRVADAKRVGGSAHKRKRQWETKGHKKEGQR